MKTYWGSEGIASHILNFGPLCLRDRSRPYPLDRRLGGPQSRSERGGEDKNPIIAPVGKWTPVVQVVA
jgi:hypothetical protein